jgi:hypothetical protein
MLTKGVGGAKNMLIKWAEFLYGVSIGFGFNPTLTVCAG